MKIVPLEPGIYLLEKKVPVSGIIECVCTFGNITEPNRNGSLMLVILRKDRNSGSWSFINTVSIPQKEIKSNQACKFKFGEKKRIVQQNDTFGIYIPANCSEDCPLQIAVANNSNTGPNYNYSLGSGPIPDLLYDESGVSWMTSNGSYEFNLRIKIKGIAS